MAEQRPSPHVTAGAIVTAAIVLAIGIAIAGGGFGPEEPRPPVSPMRGVTVIGTAERVVAADQAVWPVRVRASGAELGETQTELDREVDALTVFLVGEGIAQEAIDPGQPEVVDLLALPERPEGVDEDVRFLLGQTVTVRSADVSAVRTAAARLGELAKLGVQVAGATAPVFRFTGLADLKPTLLAEAVAAARDSANGVVTGADGEVGAIRHAREGELLVEPRDGPGFGSAETAAEQRVRLSVTVEFELVE